MFCLSLEKQYRHMKGCHRKIRVIPSFGSVPCFKGAFVIQYHNHVGFVAKATQKILFSRAFWFHIGLLETQADRAAIIDCKGSSADERITGCALPGAESDGRHTLRRSDGFKGIGFSRGRSPCRSAGSTRWSSPTLHETRHF
jgi:hypothetical protein